MNPEQKNILKELVEKYFVGGNDQSISSVVLKKNLEAIRDFVKETF